jgi:2-methylcitrate dehydratase PrpD
VPSSQRWASPEPAASILAAFAAGLELDDVPPRVARLAALHVLDTLGVALAAAGTGAAAHATAVAEQQGGAPQASAIGIAARLPAAQAAFANGTLAHALDFDDTHEEAIAHVSAVVAPAALAAAEACGATGARALAAYVAGAEVIGRLGAAAGGLYARGFHPTSVLGVFGATAAAARAQGAGHAVTVNALGIAGSFASGLFAYLDDGSATKPLHAGWAAQAGVQAVALARAGATGPARVLESRFGLLASHMDDPPDLAPRLADLGAVWETERLSIKAYPAFHFVHAAVHQAAALCAERALSPEDIASVTVAIPAEGVGLVLDPLDAKHAPRTPYDAKFSLPYCVAARLVTGRLDVRSFAPPAIADEQVLALARRVTARKWGPEPPPSRFAARVEIETTGGTHGQSPPAGPPGTPAARLGEDQIREKFLANATHLLDEAPAGRLADAVLDIADCDDLVALLAPLRATGREAP